MTKLRREYFRLMKRRRLFSNMNQYDKFVNEITSSFFKNNSIEKNHKKKYCLNNNE